MTNVVPGPSDEFVQRQMRGFDILSLEMKTVLNLVNAADKILVNEFNPARGNEELVEMLWSLVRSMQLIAGKALEEAHEKR